jgi:hypothetical protein
MATSLEAVFGHRVRFSVTSVSSNTTTRYRSFADAVDEVIDARVYAGIHFRKLTRMARRSVSRPVENWATFAG